MIKNITYTLVIEGYNIDESMGITWLTTPRGENGIACMLVHKENNTAHPMITCSFDYDDYYAGLITEKELLLKNIDIIKNPNAPGIRRESLDDDGDNDDENKTLQ